MWKLFWKYIWKKRLIVISIQLWKIVRFYVYSQDWNGYSDDCMKTCQDSHGVGVLLYQQIEEDEGMRWNKEARALKHKHQQSNLFKQIIKSKS